MDPVWLGPYVINRSVGKGLYELKNNSGEVLKKKANIVRLKLFVPRNIDRKDDPSSKKPAADVTRRAPVKRKTNEDNHSAPKKAKTKTNGACMGHHRQVRPH